jgi:hypothetical protein
MNGKAYLRDMGLIPAEQEPGYTRELVWTRWLKEN